MQTSSKADSGSMDDYVTKPLRRGDLLASIAKMMNPNKQGTSAPSETQSIFSR
jgi:DNA-binding response OmpR family regulator